MRAPDSGGTTARHDLLVRLDALGLAGGAEAFKIIDERGSRPITHGGIFLETLEANCFQVARNAAIRHARRFCCSRRSAMQHFHRRFAVKRRMAGQHVVQNRAKAIDISGRGDVARVGRLLRRHVEWRTKNGERLREITFALQPFRKTEVADVRFVRSIEQDVRRFKVAMQNPMVGARTPARGPD